MTYDSVPAIALRDVTKIYPGHIRALSHATFEVRPDELCCLLGPNGAGKSTIIRLLQGALSPTDGEVTLFVLGSVVPLEGLILIGVPGLVAITICAVALVAVASVALLWSIRLLSFERLLGAA